MTNIDNVLAKIMEVSLSLARHGGDKTFKEEYNARMKDLGKAVCTEQDLPFPSFDLLSLPGDTNLGPNSETLFNNLCTWLSKQNH